MDPQIQCNCYQNPSRLCLWKLTSFIKFIWKCREPRIAKITLKKKSELLYCVHSRLVINQRCKSSVTLALDWLTDQQKSPKVHPHTCCEVICNKGSSRREEIIFEITEDLDAKKRKSPVHSSNQYQNIIQNGSEI
jgi:hypothetical protein